MNIYINKHTREDFCSQILQFYRAMNKIWKNIDYYHMALFIGRERGKSCRQFQVGQLVGRILFEEHLFIKGFYHVPEWGMTIPFCLTTDNARRTKWPIKQVHYTLSLYLIAYSIPHKPNSS